MIRAKAPVALLRNAVLSAGGSREGHSLMSGDLRLTYIPVAQWVFSFFLRCEHLMVSMPL